MNRLQTHEAWKGTRVLVTGGSGFIGSHLVRSLLSLGAHVCVTSKNDPWRLADITNKFERATLTLGDRQRTRDICSSFKPYIVVHLAGLLPRVAAHACTHEAVQINGTMMLFEEAQAHHFITLGSASEYGRLTSPINEDAVAMPFDEYGKSKLDTTMSLKEKTTSSFTTVLRPWATNGQTQKYALFVPVCIRACLTKTPLLLSPGEQEFDLLYVEDLIDGILGTLTRRGNSFEIINLGNGHAERLRDIALSIASRLEGEKYLLFGAQPYGEHEPFVRVLSIEKAGRLLSWHPRTPLSEGLERTIKWYSSNRDSFESLMI